MGELMTIGLVLFRFIYPSFQPVDANKGRPNIVLIMADDMGFECLGVNGSTVYRTPNLDRLASTGARFEQCYSQPLCTPSRVKIMTGKYNFRNYEDFGFLNPNQVTFGNLLQEAGYSTCIAGKWQLNGLNRNNPGNQDVNRPYHFGFDEYCLWQLHHNRSDGERYANPLFTKNGEDLPRNKDAYGPDVIADFLCDFIDRKAENPFFIYYPMVLPHDPFVPTPDTPEWADPNKRYDSDTMYFKDMVAYIDKIIGQIELKLKEKKVWENTLFIFTSDNGTNPSVISHTKNGAVHGGKGSSLNTGNHVPLIISWPEGIKPGIVIRDLVDFTDFLPTLADVAGVDPEAYYTDGISLKKLITGASKREDKKEIFIHYAPSWGTYEHNRWVMNDRYKLYQNGNFYNTIKDPDERYPNVKFSNKERNLKRRFENILLEKEVESPFSIIK